MRMPIALALLCPRRDLDPRLRARGSGRIIRSGARTVIPIRLRRLLFHDDRRGLDNNRRWWRRVVVGWRVIPPPRAPPERGADYDGSVAVVVPTRDERDWRKRRSRHSMTSTVLCTTRCNRHEKERDCQKGAD